MQLQFKNPYYPQEEIDSLTSGLWKIVNSSLTYSFVNDPLPVFYLLHARFCYVTEIKITEEDVNLYGCNFVDWDSPQSDLLDTFPDKCKATLFREKELFDSFFCSTIEGFDTGCLPHGRYKYVHRELVDYFINKYNELSGKDFELSNKVLKCFVDYSDLDLEEFEVGAYFPFAGLCSLPIYYLDECCYFLGNCCYEENDPILNLIAKVRLCAYGYNSGMVLTSEEMSKSEELWFYKSLSVMLSFPPFGKTVNIEDENGEKTKQDAVENLIDKFCCSEYLRQAYLILPESFTYDSKYKTLRKRLIDENLLLKIREIPAGSLTNSSSGLIIVSLGRGEYYHNKDKKVELSYSEGDKEGRIITYTKIEEADYLLLPCTYNPAEISLADGQQSFKMGDCFDIRAAKYSGYFNKPSKVIPLKDENFASNGMSLVKLKDNKFDTARPDEEDKVYEGKSLVLKFIPGGISVCPYSEDLPFTCSSDCLVLSIKEKFQDYSLDYLASAIIDSAEIKSLPLSGINFSEVSGEIIMRFSFPMFTDSNKQEEVIESYKKEYWKQKIRELEAERQRLGIRTAAADMVHLLGPTFNRIGNILDSDFESPERREQKIKALVDNFDYMKRVMKATGNDFMAEKDTLNPKVTDVNQFFRSYVESQRNIEKSVYRLEYQEGVTDGVSFSINKDIFSTMLDTILDNAYRHGFNKSSKPGNMVRISTSCVEMLNKNYILVSVANNGEPFPEGFSKEKYISRGEFCGENGHTGLGGNHVYSITKIHDGYLNITQTEAWPVIFDILIPVKGKLNESQFIKAYEYAKDCM